MSGRQQIAKAERVANVLFTLRDGGRLTRAALCRRVPGYPRTRDAQRQRLLRDLNELRELGFGIKAVGVAGSEQEAYELDQSTFWPSLDALVGPGACTSGTSVILGAFAALTRSPDDPIDLADLAGTLSVDQKALAGFVGQLIVCGAYAETPSGELLLNVMVSDDIVTTGHLPRWARRPVPGMQRPRYAQLLSETGTMLVVMGAPVEEPVGDEGWDAAGSVRSPLAA